MTAPDVLCLTLIACELLLDHFVVWRVFLRRSQVDPTRARLWLYRALVVELWSLVACVVSLWLYQERQWTLLRWSAPQGWRLWTSVALVLALTTTLVVMVVRIVRLRRRRRVRVRSGALAHAPHTRSELAWWAGVSLSAGVSEELICRGYLLWVFQPHLGLWGAAALSLVVFAAAHAYNGAAGVLAAAILGAAMTIVVLVFGSLWPAMAMHVLIDLQQGLAAWIVLREDPDPKLVATPPVPSSVG